MKINISILKIVIQIQKKIWSKNWYLNSKLIFSNLKIIIQVLKNYWV